MKKVISIVLSVLIALSCTGALADAAASADMEKALLNVKQKLTVPDELSEFVPNAYESGGKTFYSFIWQSEDNNSYMEVSSDSCGRINRYYFYDNTLKSEKKLTTLSKADILEFAGEFLKKALPEAFSDDDVLTPDADSWNVNNLVYSLTYKRVHEGIEVKDNNVTLRIAVYDDIPYIRSMNVSYDYDAGFEKLTEEAENYAEKYKEAFPPELIFKDDYSKDDDKKTVLVYRYKDGSSGYILASTGDTAEEDAVEETGEIFNKSESMAMSADSASGGASRFTEKEIKELERIGELEDVQSMEKTLKTLPYVNFDSSLKRDYYNLTERDGKYIVSLAYSDTKGERYISASFDGETGELLSLYNRAPYKKSEDMTESQKKQAQKRAEEFLVAAAGERLKEFSSYLSEAQDKSVICSYDRVVQGVRYVSDGMHVQYNAEQGIITSYSMDYDEKRSFSDIGGAMTADEAYEALIKAAPLKKIYVRTGGNYKVCYTASVQEAETDAFTGEKYLPYKSYESSSYEYGDIKGHWAEEKIAKLSEIQIGLEGDSFRPDEAISQYDILRLFGAGIRYKSYLNYTEDELYDILTSEDILTPEQKNPESPVSREDAFAFMIKLDGLDKVARLTDIFKVEYEDSALISDGKIGYPAILTGMGIICGSGGRLRPADNITRAEAAVMVYNYMTK